jgi:hypothetical protein
VRKVLAGMTTAEEVHHPPSQWGATLPLIRPGCQPGGRTSHNGDHTSAKPHPRCFRQAAENSLSLRSPGFIEQSAADNSRPPISCSPSLRASQSGDVLEETNKSSIGSVESAIVDYADTFYRTIAELLGTEYYDLADFEPAGRNRCA